MLFFFLNRLAAQEIGTEKSESRMSENNAD